MYASSGVFLVAARSQNGQIGSDNWFDGGETGTVDKPADYGRPAQPLPIEGTAERDAMATYRHGSFAYHIPAPAGRYKVTLWFVATKGQPEGRFDVAANGKSVLRKFEAKAAANGAQALSRSFTVTSRGMVDLAFTAGSAPAHVALIELDKQ